MILDVDPTAIDAVLITHAHVDHLGGLPIFYNNGLGHDEKAKIFCTKPTISLAEIMLLDTANIAERESLKKIHRNDLDRKVVKKIRKEYENNGRKATIDKFNLGWAIQPYSVPEAIATMHLFKSGGCDYGKWFKVAKKVEAKFYPSGHVLGGAIIVLNIKGDNQGEDSIKIGFSGDLGRRDGVILPPPETVQENLDHWVTESTYGGIDHPDRSIEIENLKLLVQECYKKKGKLYIPSFALERAQEIIYLLSYYMFKKEIPEIPIVLDSPMAANILQIFAENWRTQLFKDQYKVNFEPFKKGSNRFLKISRTQIESNHLVLAKGPLIVVAGSGMGDAGRIRNHYKKGLGLSKNTVAIVGYMVEGTLNRNLVNGNNRVKIDGKYYSVNARVEKFGGFSAHADRGFLTDYIQEITKSPNLKTIFINHGGEKNGLEMEKNIIERLGEERSFKVIIPRLYDRFDLN